MPQQNKRFTKIQLLFLQEQYQILTDRDLHVAFNRRFHYAKRTYKSIRSALRNHRMTCGGSHLKKVYRAQLLTKKQCDWLEANYVDVSQKEITAAFNKKYGTNLTAEQMKTFISNRGFKSGRTGCFGKGNVPWQSGKAGTGLCKPNSGSFQPGPRPDMRSQIGHERIDKNGYILIKVAMKNPHTGIWGHYVFKHRAIWEAVNGPIPKDHVLTFIDDDLANCILENLELISRGELCRRNKLQYKKAPIELRSSLKTLAKLQHYTGQRARSE